MSNEWGFPGGLLVKNLLANLEDVGSITGSRSFPGEGNGNPVQYSCLESPMDRGTWWATVHRVPALDTTGHTHTFQLPYVGLNRIAFKSGFHLVALTTPVPF